MEHPDTHTNNNAPAKPRNDLKHELLELCKMVLVFLMLFWGLKSFVIEGYEVQGPSMYPTLAESERILVFKLPHQLSRLGFLEDWTRIDTGDIVVFESTVENNKRYIKRVIALGPPPERGNTVIASTHEVPTREVEVQFDQGLVYVDHEPIDESGYLVPEEMYTREHRLPVILGRGEYYVLGDHRSVSKDSRSFGPIHDEQIIGQAVLRFWPLSQIGFL